MGPQAVPHQVSLAPVKLHGFLEKSRERMEDQGKAVSSSTVP